MSRTIARLGQLALQTTGVTDTAGGYGGGTISVMNLGTLASTALTQSGGTAYAVPTGYIAGLAGLTETIGSGLLESQAAGPATAGAAFDLSKNLIVPISLTNTNVGLFD